MKIAFVTTFFLCLILPFQVVRAQGETKYVADKATGAKVLRNFVEPCKDARWSGKIDSAGYATGDGILEMQGDHGRKERFTGTMKQGAPVAGKYEWIKGGSEAGGVFVGSWIDGERSGKGNYLYPDGTRYIGEWAHNVIQGQGTSYERDGSIYYSGRWVAGSPVDLVDLKEALEKQLLLAAPLPDYPYQPNPAFGLGSMSGEKFGTSRGIFDLRFDYETGRLREVHMVRSTGSRKLDGRSIAALKLWKAKPRAIHVLRVPTIALSNR